MNRAKLLGVIVGLLLFSSSFITSMDTSDDEIRSTLRTILENPKYEYLEAQEKKEGPANKFLENLYHSIADFFNSLSSLPFPVMFLISIIILVVLTVAITYIIYKLNIRFAGPGKRVKKETLFEKENYNFMIELERARDFISKGLYKRGVSTVLNALWLFMHYSQRLTYRKSKTNREYLRQISRDESIEQIKALVLQSEKAVYLKENIDEEETNSIYDTVEKIISG